MAGLVLRLYSLGEVPLRWDEGWSIALAALTPAEMVRLTALDVHPPLYYVLLRPWLAVGSAHEIWMRLFSVVSGTLAIPLAAAATAAWWRGTGRLAAWAGLFAAGYVAIAPALVYYSGVVRMYALTTPLLLVAAWGLARLARTSAKWGLLATVLGISASLYTFYYAGLAVTGLFCAALIAWTGRWRRFALAATVSALAYLPWLVYATPEMLDRVGSRMGGGFELAPALSLAGDGICAVLLCQPTGALAVWIPLAVLAIGSALARPLVARRLGVSLLPTVAVLVGAGLGAQAHMFAARYAIVATPFVAMGLGWALAGLTRRQLFLGAAGAAAVVAAALPSLTGYVYERAAEVTATYDPATDWRELAHKSSPDDLVVFNILSLAGAYERYRTAADPDWTYAQLWDPVHEGLPDATDRLSRAARSLRSDPAPGRLWLVLYMGTAALDTEVLKTWVDTNYYPSDGWWHEDTLYQSYVVSSPDTGGFLGEEAPAFENGVELVSARYESTVVAGSGAAVALGWRSSETPGRDARVFVHLYDEEGALLAQHDSYPAANTRPPTSWAPDEVVFDRHGLFVPENASGPLTLVVGLYDPASGARWRRTDAPTAESPPPLGDGRGAPDGAVLGQVRIKPAP